MGLLGWSVLEAGQTFLFGYALAHALDQGFLRGRQGTGLWWLALAAAAVPVGAYGTARVFGAVAALVEPVRDRLVRHVVRGGLATAVRAAARGGGRPADSAVVSRLTHQVEIARDSLGGIVMVLRSFAFTAAGVVAGMIALAPVLLLVVLPPLVAGTALFTLALRPLARRQRDFLAADEAVAEECGALAGGLRDITACGAQRPMAERADRRIADAQRASRALATWGVTRTLALAVAGQLPLVLLLTASPWLLSTHRLTPGALLGALAYLTQSLQPALQSLLHTLTTSGTRLTVVLTRLTSPPPGAATGSGSDAPAGGGRGASAPAWRAFGGGSGESPAAGKAPVPRAGVAAGGGPGESAAAAKVLAPRGGSGESSPAGEPPAPHPRPGGAKSGAGGAVELRGVTFAYGVGAEPVLRGLDLVVAPGEHLAVVGPSGVGKSTLGGLVAGLLVADAGVVRRGGAVALVPQEAYVFRGTVGENVGYLREHTTPALVWAAAAAVGAGGLVDALGGPDAQVDPGALSQGERQLLALARTYLAPAAVVVLDEATCHLDPAAEASAERAFADRPATTLIVIAHRISSARRADRTLVLDGADTMCGPHAELLVGSPLYRDLAAAWTAVS
ncbi:ABC transporter ATP-binding protein RamB [Actinacidiphila bryophytorum]|uniref:ABC transporter ATP-binding protein RamB n=2 Tax=Actinacidiphila bryophytorum TaxID=1436133 RepID=A0A9W4E4B5_9ACTN|nr:ABC transporter ATP-binding protein RamB [Actinacidiphila bryophytorum]